MEQRPSWEANSSLASQEIPPTSEVGAPMRRSYVIGRCSARRALKPKFYQPTQTMITARILPFSEISHGTAGNRTRDLMISSQRLWPLDHEALLLHSHKPSTCPLNQPDQSSPCTLWIPTIYTSIPFSPHLMVPRCSSPHSQEPATCPYSESHQSSPFPHPTSWRSILILYSHPRQSLPCGSFPPRFHQLNQVYALVFSIHATCPAHLLLYLITRII